MPIIPTRLLRTAERSVAARERSNAYFQATGPRTDREDGLNGHEYFVDVLKSVIHTLRPRTIIYTPPSSTASVEHVDPGHPLNNIFANLDIEEQIEEDSSTIDSTATPASAAADTPIDDNKQTGPDYDIEAEDEAERLCFALFCLFEDINKLRQYVYQIWESFHQQESELISVSIVTNTAIEIVRRLEDDFKKEFPKQSSTKEIITIPYGIRSLLKGRDPSSRERPDDMIDMVCYEESDWVMLSVFMLLDSFLKVIQPGQAPFYKPGHFGIYDPTRSWSHLSDRQKMQDDKLVLLERLPSIVVLASNVQYGIAEDEFTRGIGVMAKTKTVPLWVVFAAQCFLESHHALREDVSMAYDKLKYEATIIRNGAQGTSEYHKDLKFANWPKQNDDTMTHLLVNQVDRHVLNDKVHAAMKRAHRGLPIPEPFYIHQQHPLWCGIMLFSLHLHAQELGTTLVNAWGSALYAAHLYNAVRQEKSCENTWPEMEALIQIHSEERMLVGGRPKDPDQYLKRFLICMGYSTVPFHQGNRSRGIKASKQGPRSLLEVSPVARLFKKRFMEGGSAGALLDDLTLLEEFLNNRFESKTDWSTFPTGNPSNSSERAVDLEVQARAAGSRVSKKLAQTQELHPVELLLALYGSIEDETSELSFDYFGFHQKCWSLLRVVQKELHQSLLPYVDGPGYLDNETQLPFVVGYIFATAAQSDKAAKQFLKLKEGQKTTSRLLQSAGVGVNIWIDHCKELDRRRGREIVFEE